tara:strand:- start:2472 stop:3053 length:582 start_codon:yes stop_codon:yes gene_type:complete
MNKNNITQEINSKNLIQSSTLLNSITNQYTPFFGTLLGLHRDGDVIEGDDDVDYLAPSELYGDIKQLFLANGYTLTQFDVSDVFTQFKTTIDSVEVLIDFYYYIDYNEDYVIDKWNFFGQYYNTSKWMAIPKPYLFDFKPIQYKGTSISMASDPESICKYLYGERYSEPLSKKTQYDMTIVNNMPKIIYKNEK